MTGGGPVPWRVELSRSALEVLRRLPRRDQRTVARSIEQLQGGGPPPRGGAERGTGQEFTLHAGAYALACRVAHEERMVVVVTLVLRDAPAHQALGALALGWWRRRTGGGVMETTRRLGQAARALARAPGFTAAAVLTLGLGIGASTAVFSVADGVLFEPLPYGESERVVTVWSQWSGFPKTWVSEPEYVNYWQQNRTLEDLALYFTSSHTFTSPDNPELVGSGVVSPNTFDVLGVAPTLGRSFTWEEARAEAPVVLLGHAAWQRRFGADPGIVGRDVEINGSPFTVLGVLPAGFVLPVDYGSASPSEIYFASPVDRERSVEVPPSGGSHGYFAVGRLRDGVSVAQARADLEGIAGRLEAEGIYPPVWGFRPLVDGVEDDIVGDARGTLYFLMGACGLLLLLACANVANLMLSRSEARVRDVAVRRALGAGRGDVIRGLLLESGLLAAGGAVVGLLLAHVGVGAVLGVDPAAVPRAATPTLDAGVLGFALAVTGLSALLFGWIPAVRAARSGVAGSLHGAGRGAGAGARSNRTQGFLVAGQMALAVTLMAAAGLTMRTFTALSSVDLGFETDEVLTARLTVPSATYPDLADVTGFWDELLREARAIPGVARAGAARLLPLDSQMGDSGFRPVGYVAAEGEQLAAEWQYVSHDYVEAMGMPLLAGRAFRDSDGSDSPVVMMINQAAAERFWPGASPLGARVATFGGDTATVVGVVGNLRHNGVTAEIKPRYYRSLRQLDGPGNIRRMTLVLRAEARAADLAGPLRTLVRSLDPTMPLSRVQTLNDVARDALAGPRFAMTLLAAFSLLALGLASVGVYGVLAYAVSRRTQEIGVRMALGAEEGTVVRMVVGQGMRMAALGVVGGVLAALGLTRFMEGMLYQVEPSDPLTFLAVPAVLAAVALVACWVPAARAARIPPTEALRYE